MVNSQIKILCRKIWEFIREDISVKDFEIWVYTTQELKEFLPSEMYFDLFYFDYQKSKNFTIYNLRQLLKEWLVTNHPGDCRCPQIKNKDKYGLSGENNIDLWCFKYNYFKNNYITLHSDGYLKLYMCSKCDTYWCIGEFFEYGSFVLLRLNATQVEKIRKKNIWPSYFDEQIPLHQSMDTPLEKCN